MDEHVLDAAARLMGFGQWDQHQRIGGGRGLAFMARKGERSFVVKHYKDDLGGARERAALAALDGAAGVPRLMAEMAEPACVVMTHLDGTSSLADTLLSSDAGRAGADLHLWAEALAAVHTAGNSTTRAAFSDALRQRAPAADPRVLPGDFGAAADQYAALLRELELPPYDEP